MTPERFRNIVEELMIDNPLAVRPLLRILEINFTQRIPTLAVTCEERPTLNVNLAFLEEHCRTDAHVKAVVLHEFLHIVLRHTERRRPATEAEHLATDAVINAIIHRQCGTELSSMMSSYYEKESGIRLLLRPQETNDRVEEPLQRAWYGLYAGHLVVDDIRELAADFAKRGDAGPRRCEAKPSLLGGHQDGPPVGDDLLRDALEDTMRQMNGSGIWRSPHGRGLGALAADALFSPAGVELRRWKQKTLEIFRRHVVPDARAQLREARPAESMLPVLSPGHRRAFMRALWSPFIPEASWPAERKAPAGSAQVYLDVSGSMWGEMPHVVALLGALRRWIRMPFWAFSTEVGPATIRDGMLVTKSTGGTSLECVLRHIAQTRPESAVVLTDGYIEPLCREWVAATAGSRIHAIVTRDGSTDLLDRGGIPSTQLGRLP
jgi:hypothetical protein